MRSLKDKIKESILDDVETSLAKGDEYIKKHKSLEIVKKYFNNNISPLKFKYNRKTDVNGKKLEIGDLVMYPYRTGGYEELYKYNLGVIIDIYSNDYGSYVKLNINGNEDKPSTDTVYCINVMKVTPNMVKNLYR